jgi:hypothetical protein
MREITWNEADALAGRRLDRRRKYATTDAYDPRDPFDNDGPEPGEECGRWSNGRLSGSCALAGTEECDSECPYR